MIDLLIIHPGAQHGIYGALGETLTALEPPTWARMIAGYVRDRGFSVRIIDAEAEQLSPEMVTLQVATYSPRLIAIVVSGHQPSASTQQMVGAGAIARTIREKLPHQKIIMLGNHPSALPERTLREEAIDFVADGEGPVTIIKLLNILHQHEHSHSDLYPQVPGLVWRSEGRVFRNPLAPLVEGLDADLHGNVWDLLPMHLYRAHQWQCFGDLSERQPYASVYATLGCPFRCSFCMINTFQHSNQYRRFSPGFVVNQIAKLYDEYGVSTIKIADEMFILNEAHYTAICEGLISRGFGPDNLNLWAYARVDTIKPATLALLRRAGFRWLALGIESASKHVRNGAAKRLRTDDIVGTVRAVQASGINVIGNFMFGLRDDTVETMGQTLDLALECLPEFANFYSCMAYPGSKLYDDALREGWTLPETWRGYSQHNDDCRPLDTEHVGAATVLRFRDEAFRTYFTDPRYLSMVERKFGAETLEHVREMVKYYLPRKLLI